MKGEIVELFNQMFLDRKLSDQQKQGVIACIPWDTNMKVLDIPNIYELKILGVSMTNTKEQSGITSWARITVTVRAQAPGAYNRDLDLAQRILNVYAILLPKVWHIAQIFPTPRDRIRN